MKYLLLNSLYRSGKTILQMALNSHSRIQLTSYGMLPFLQAWNLKLAERNAYPVFKPLCIEYYPPVNEEHSLLWNCYFGEDDVQQLRLLLSEAMQVRLNRNEAMSRKDYEWLAQFDACLGTGSAGSILDDLMWSLPHKGSDEPIVGFMDQNLHQYLSPLLAGRSDRLYAIDILRDPRAIVASRNYGSYLQSHGGGRKHPLLLIVKMWRTAAQYRKRLKRDYPRNFYGLAYEELMSDPESHLRAACELLGVSFEFEMLETEKYRGVDGSSWKHNSSLGAVEGFDAVTNERWRDVLPDDCLAVTEYLLYHEMRECGYKPVTDCTDGLVALWQYEENPDELSEWTLEWDLQMTRVNKTQEIVRHERLGATEV